MHKRFTWYKSDTLGLMYSTVYHKSVICLYIRWIYVCKKMLITGSIIRKSSASAKKNNFGLTFKKQAWNNTFEGKAFHLTKTPFPN